MVDTTKHPVAEATCSKFASAAELLAYLKSTKGFELTAPVDVERIPNLLGIEVRETMEKEHLDAIGKIFLDDGKARIWINPFENSYAPRKRFTLAHELGHYCLHLSESKTSFTDSSKTMSRSESYWDIYESQANTFAAELLMPKELISTEGKRIVSAYREREGKEKMPIPAFIDALARTLAVSNTAMEYRLKNIGVIKQS